MTEPPRVTILDFDWPGRELPVMPGDLSQWLPQRADQAPHGEDPEPERYGGEYPGTGPILEAPGAHAGGGLLYLDDPDRPGALGKLCGALELMGVYLKTKTYAVFWGATLDVMDDRYLHQVRILTHHALSHFFKANPETDALPQQPMSVGDYIEAFIAEQQGKWNDGRRYSGVLDGMLGGDADSAREVLGFGFAVESAYLGVYRLWSRPWLCSK